MVDVKDKEVALEKSKTAFILHVENKKKDSRVLMVKAALEGEMEDIKGL